MFKLNFMTISQKNSLKIAEKTLRITVLANVRFYINYYKNSYDSIFASILKQNHHPGLLGNKLGFSLNSYSGTGHK